MAFIGDVVVTVVDVVITGATFGSRGVPGNPSRLCLSPARLSCSGHPVGPFRPEPAPPLGVRSGPCAVAPPALPGDVPRMPGAPSPFRGGTGGDDAEAEPGRSRQRASDHCFCMRLLQ